MTRRRITVEVVALLALIAIPLIAYAGVRYYWRTNTGPVVVAEIYRSGQPDRALLEKAKAQGVRTVINLRGPNAHHRWYRDERRDAAELGLTMYDFRFQTIDAPPRIELQQFVQTLDLGQKAVLIHCRDGVDRTGWGAAVALALRGAPLEQPLRELSPGRGHFCRRNQCHFHRFFAQYEEWLKRNHRTHNGSAFRQFVAGYAPSIYDARLQATTLPNSAAPAAMIEVPLRVTNGSYLPWSTTGDKAVKLGARSIGPLAAPIDDPLAVFRDPNRVKDDLGRRSFSTPAVKPGATSNTIMAFHAPSAPGLYYVQIDAVQEHVHWFSDLGRPGLVFPLTVR